MRLMNMEQPAPAATPAQHNSTQRKEHSHPKLLHAPRCPPRRACHQGLWSLDCRDVHTVRSRNVRVAIRFLAVAAARSVVVSLFSLFLRYRMPPRSQPVASRKVVACNKDAHASTGQASAGRPPASYVRTKGAFSELTSAPTVPLRRARHRCRQTLESRGRPFFFSVSCPACRARAAPPHAAASERLLAFAAARSFAASPWSLPLHGTANVDGLLPDLSDMLAEHRLDNPPHASRLPAR